MLAVVEKNEIYSGYRVHRLDVNSQVRANSDVIGIDYEYICIMKLSVEEEYCERITNTKWEEISKVDFGLLKYL